MSNKLAVIPPAVNPRLKKFPREIAKAITDRYNDGLF